jgi:hypothetical protein
MVSRRASSTDLHDLVLKPQVLVIDLEAEAEASIFTEFEDG